MERKNVYKLIDGEREYQNSRWNPDTTLTGGVHHVTDWLVYIQDYLHEAMHIVTRNADPEASDDALEIIRKIAAMSVACMEQNETKPRVWEEM